MTREQCRIGAESHRVLAGWLSEALLYIPARAPSGTRAARAQTRLSRVRVVADALRDLELDTVPEGFELLFEHCRTVHYLLEDPTPDMFALDKAAQAVRKELADAVSDYLTPEDQTQRHGYFDPLDQPGPLVQLKKDWREKNPTWRAEQLLLLRKQLNPFLYIVPSSDPDDATTLLDAAMRLSLEQVAQISDPALRLRVALRKRMSEAPDREERRDNMKRTASRALLAPARATPSGNPGCFDYEKRWAQEAQLMSRERVPSEDGDDEGAEPSLALLSR